MNDIKTHLWENKNIIFHSRDIRKCTKEFSILLDTQAKQTFYDGINEIITGSDYAILSAVINKEAYIERHRQLEDFVYERAISFLIERAVFYLDSQPGNNNKLVIVLEKRGKKEDAKLESYIQNIINYGTGYVSSYRLNNYGILYLFRAKHENINGLQLADLIAYPIARYNIDPSKPNLPFDILKGKFYTDACRSNIYGIKTYP